MKNSWIKDLDYSKLETGDIVFTGGRGIFPAIIRWVTKSKITHVAVIVDIAGEKLLAEMRGKLVLCSPKRYLKSRVRGIHSIYRVTGLSDDDRGRMLETVAYDLRRTLDYDWGGVFSFVFKFFKQNPEKYFCSEYVVEKIIIPNFLNVMKDTIDCISSKASPAMLHSYMESNLNRFFTRVV